MELVQIDAKLLAEARDLIYLDGRRPLLIVAIDSVLRAAQAPPEASQPAPVAERPVEGNNVPPNQSEAK